MVIGADGDKNTQPPLAGEVTPTFPYWDHVVARGKYSAVYLGDQWVLSAGHIGAGDVEIRGERYRARIDTEIDLRTGFFSADLVLFRIVRDPGLPRMALTPRRPEIGEQALLLGYGHSAGAPTAWHGMRGQYWEQGPALLRWGRNRVSRLGVRASSKGSHTESFAFRFDPGGGEVAESQAASGDSGGAVFVRRDGAWALAGILIMIQRHRGQPSNIALAGNQTFAADLALYTEQIELITGLRVLGRD